MEQPVPTTDAEELQADVEEVEAATDESPAVQRAEDEVNDEPTSTADELSERAGGPDLAEEVPAVVEGEVIDETEEATFESEEPDVPGATGAADPGSDIPTEPVAEEAEQPLVASEDAAAIEGAEPEVIEPGDAELAVEPELAAAVEEALEGAELPEGEAVEPEFLPGDWYVVHTYAGYENKVKADLETRVASMNMEEQIYEVVIPMEDVVEVKGGKKVTVQRKVFPGYLLVRMELSDDSWYVVRNTPGVTGFVGSGTKPIPLSEREVDKILKRKGEAEKPRPRAEWQLNDPVRVTTGPFANFQGVINEVDDERQKVKVLVNIFGRETPVELSYDQISKV
ncbi:MAG: transcription termination/antitermination protein NusG [Actinomycetota bacterium]